MNTDPLVRYLIELASQPEAKGIVLTGGFGMRVKQNDLKRRGVRTLIADLPEARATSDLDIILSLEFWLELERGREFRKMLTRLGYDVTMHSWQFRKVYEDSPDLFLKIDLQARQAEHDEPVKSRKEKWPEGVRQIGSGMRIGLGGLALPEGFAVDDKPVEVGLDWDGRQTTILVPHPYAWLNIKTRAAHDWLKEQRGEKISTANRETGVSKRLKHVFDVYVLVAMLTVEELDEAGELAKKYSMHEEAKQICGEAMELFGTPEARGVAAIRQAAVNAIDYELFWEGLSRALNIVLDGSL